MSEAPLSDIFRLDLTVSGEVIDGNGHVNNVAYVQWMQDVAIDHFTSLGGSILMDEHGVSWVARSHRIEYLRPAFEGERLCVRTWIADMERVRSRRCYEFLRGDEMLARGDTDWVLVDRATGRPKRIPEAMKDAVRSRSQ